MLISLATFEHLPIRVGGLAEAATSIGEELAELGNEVLVLMPSHGIQKRNLLETSEYGRFKLSNKGREFIVTIYESKKNGVRIFLFSDELMDHEEVYPAEYEIFYDKIFHYARAVPGWINLFLKKERRKPEIFHSNDWHAILGGLLAKKYFNIPIAYTIHRICHPMIPLNDIHEEGFTEFVREDFINEHLLNLELMGGSHCDIMNTVSFTYLNEKWESFFSKFDGKVTYVWNGMDYSFWDFAKLRDPATSRQERKKRLLEENSMEDGILYFYVGRLDLEQKGVEHFLTAIEKILQGKIPGADDVRDNLRFIILGAGDIRLEARVREMEKHHPHHFRGIIGYLARETTREYYAAADFCVIPSIFEPFGLVQLEAMCLGCIPLGSSVGGIKDTVGDIDELGDKGHGKLFPPRDDHALAETIVRMARLYKDEPGFIEKVRGNGRPHVINKFNWKRAAERYLALYNSSVTKKIPFVDYGEPY